MSRPEIALIVARARNGVIGRNNALPWRLRGDEVQILLVTSRRTRRWIIPKGNIEPGKTAPEAALQEAFEEAGVRGILASEIPLGFYTYFKRRTDQHSLPVSVEVFLLEVTEQLKKWPEKGKRKLRWLPIARAIKKLEEPGVVPLMQRLAELFPED